MKIGIVTGQFGNIFRGGAEVQIDNTVESLVQHGIECVQVTHSTRSIDDLDLIHFFKTDDSYLTLSEYLLKINKPYVISTIFYPETIQQRQYYYTISKLSNFLGVNKTTAARRINFLRDANCLFPNTHAELIFVEKISKNKFINIVPNCIESIFLSNNVTKQLFYDFYPPLRNKPFILCVGRIEQRKNQLSLVRACADLNYSLLLIGSVTDPKYWEACKTEGKDFLHQIAYTDNQELLISAYKSCKIYAQPSTMETPGLSAMEAAAQGANILVTKNGGTREYFGDNAYYVDPFDQRNVTDTLRSMLSNVANHVENNATHRIHGYDVAAKLYIKSYNKILFT